MSLLIEDMDMPKSCMECICLEAFDDEIYGRQFFCGLLGIDALAKEHSRHKKCPLSEIPTPHGRLIDVDDIDNITVVFTERGTLKRIDAPTVIEAEE